MFGISDLSLISKTTFFWRGDKTNELQITFHNSEILVQVLRRITQYSTGSWRFLKTIAKLLIKNNVPREDLIVWETSAYIQMHLKCYEKSYL